MTNESGSDPIAGIDRDQSRDEHEVPDRAARLDEVIDDALRQYAELLDRLSRE